jgi:methionyl-tRNA formyltransferase
LTASSTLRIVFAGTPDFAVAPLQALLDAGHLPIAVLTQPDRRAGRGLKVQASPVKQAALEAGIPVFQPESLKTTELQAWLSELQPDLMIVVAYGLILPQAVLDIPKHGCWNVHASLLPRWRGAAPIQRAIEAGDRQSGVCIMQMDAGLDTGDVLLSQNLVLAENETGGSLHDRLAALGASSLVGCVDRLSAGEEIVAIPQPTEGITYARKLDKQEARIDWQQTADSLARRIRAFNPWPVCWCELDGERTRIWNALAEPIPEPALFGSIIESGTEGIVVACGEGQLRITQLQRPGGRVVAASDYVKSRTLEAGHRLK